MIQICPAVLTNDNAEFDRELSEYSKIFEKIDVDVNIEGDDFEGKVTIHIDKIVKAIEKYDTDFNIHLMVSEPYKLIDKITDNLSSENEQKVRFLVHQESDISNIGNYDNLDVGIVVKAESDLRDIGFYSNFPEVQFMTIETGVQGNPLKPEILDRVGWLRDQGYGGAISLDGGINAETAKIISKHDVDRVSVGSYFSKAGDLERAYDELDKVLNG